MFRNQCILKCTQLLNDPSNHSNPASPYITYPELKYALATRDMSNPNNPGKSDAQYTLYLSLYNNTNFKRYLFKENVYRCRDTGFPNNPVGTPSSSPIGRSHRILSEQDVDQVIQYYQTMDTL